MKTKEEIVESHFGSDFHEVSQPCCLVHICNAMEEYAKAYHEDKTRWISVEERLPEVDNKDNPFGERIDCLVVYDGYVYKGQYMNIGEPFWSVSHICTSSSLDVTKWMLLPRP